jgi:TonB family protein
MVVRGRSGAPVALRAFGLLGLLLASSRGLAAPPAGDESSIEAPVQKAPPPPAPKPAAVVPPKALETPAPAYPEGASGDATVVLELTVARDGSVRDAKVVSGEEPFASVALAAVQGFRFEPARRGGEPIAARVRFELRFHEPPPAPAEPNAAPGGAAVATAPPPAPPSITEVIVRGVLPEAPKRTFTRAEVREIPGTFGDPFRAIEVIPGVTPIITGVPYFFVRGAPPGNVGYYLDGVRVPLLFHFALGPSVIHPGLIERVDLYPGGYPARYGRFAGGIVAAETVAPKDELHGEVNVRIFDAGAMVEAPIADGRGHVLAGGRYSYTGGILSLVAPEVTLTYWDYQLRADYALGPRDDISVFGFGAYDLFTVDDEFAAESGVGTQFHRVDLRWDRKLGDATKLRTAVALGFDKSGNVQNEDDLLVAKDYMLQGRLELEHRASPTALVRAGLDVTADEYRFALVEPVGSEGSLERTIDFAPRTDVAVGVRGDVVWEAERGVTVTPGLRLDLYTSGGAYALGIDPRIAARFDVSRAISLENTFGIVHQPPSFVVPIPGFTVNPLDGGLQQAFQSSAGVEWRLGDEWTSTLTLFHNAFIDITDYLSLARFEEVQVEEEEDLFRRSLGQAYGLELMIRRPLTRRFGGYLAYTLMRSQRMVETVNDVASFDRTHVLHVAGAYDLGRRWRMGARLTFYTGVPASYAYGDFSEPAPIGPEGAPPAPPQRIAEIPETSARAPAFFRVDLRVEKRWPVGTKGAWVAFVMEVLNSTLSRETLDYTCFESGRCEGSKIGPVTVPSIGLEAAF